MRILLSTRTTTPTNDEVIRTALLRFLHTYHAQDEKVRIIEELGISHGAGRIDIAVVNGIMHGYEIKSDQDTLHRLPEQIAIFNAVFDKITLVVGKNHLLSAIHLVPDWWGIIVAKNIDGHTGFNRIREEDFNDKQDSVSLARLLWRDEALRILENAGKARGLYSKPRQAIYERLSVVFDRQTLGDKVREMIFVRTNWRPDQQLIPSGG